MNQIDAQEFESIIEEVDFHALLNQYSYWISEVDLNSPVFGQDLKIYLVLKFLEDRFFPKYSKLEVFYSKYYYFLNFVERCKNVRGKDAGLDQQVFQLLEEGERIQNIDWSVIEYLNKLTMTNLK
jgi:hypothetical protein